MTRIVVQKKGNVLPLISSAHNPRVKQAAQLRDRKGRQSQSRIIIDGTREIARALASDLEFVEVFINEAMQELSSVRQLCDEFMERGIPLLPVASRVYAKLAYGERDEGMVAICRTPRRSLDSFQLQPAGLVVVLVGIEKPGNIGAIVRSADGAGVGAVIVADGGTDLYNPNSIRASLGTLFTVRVFETTSTEALQWLRRSQIVMHAAHVNADRRYHDVSWRNSSALILGSETVGLREPWIASDIIPVSLPMLGEADSLNVSVTAAVILYEALRQRA